MKKGLLLFLLSIVPFLGYGQTPGTGWFEIELEFGGFTSSNTQGIVITQGSDTLYEAYCTPANQARYRYTIVNADTGDIHVELKSAYSYGWYSYYFQSDSYLSIRNYTQGDLLSLTKLDFQNNNIDWVGSNPNWSYDTVVNLLSQPPPFAGCMDTLSSSYDTNANISNGQCAYPVDFAVDMNSYPDTFSQVYVSGQFNSWSGIWDSLADPDGDGIWTGTIDIGNNPGWLWKYSVDNWADQELPSDLLGGANPYASCFLYDPVGPFANRVLEVNGAPVVLDTNCWEKCLDCADVIGCTDSTSSEFNPWATISDGQCQGSNLPTLAPGETYLEIVFTPDNYGSESSWILYDDNGAVETKTQGTYSGATPGIPISYYIPVDTNILVDIVINDTYGDGLNGSLYGGTVDGNLEVFDCSGNKLFSLADSVASSNFGYQYTSPQFNTGSVCLSGPAPIPGCTDPFSLNYNPNATVDATPWSPTNTVNLRSLKTHNGNGTSGTGYSGNANTHSEFDNMVNLSSSGTTLYLDTAVDILSLQGPRGIGSWDPPRWGNESFAIIYTGWFKPNETGNYAFRTRTDDSHEFMIKGLGYTNDIVTKHYGFNTWNTKTNVYLDSATWYEFEIRIQNNGGAYGAQFEYRVPGGTSYNQLAPNNPFGEWSATSPDTSVNNLLCGDQRIVGCTDSTSFNYDPNANTSEVIFGDYTLKIYDGQANGWGGTWLGIKQGDWLSPQYQIGPNDGFDLTFDVPLNIYEPIELYLYTTPQSQNSIAQVAYTLYGPEGDTIVDVPYWGAQSLQFPIIQSPTAQPTFGDVCIEKIFGCTDTSAFNFDPLANTLDSSCIPVIVGCMNPLSFNYDSTANVSGTCIPIIVGCLDSTQYNYDSTANTAGTCIPFIYGCTDSTQFNYSPLANTSDNSCIPFIYGCTDPTSFNYDSTANVNNGTCIPTLYGCTDSTSFNYNPLANTDNGSCIPKVYGCTNVNSINYNPVANIDDSTCIPIIYGCTDTAALNYNPLANTDNGTCIPKVYGCTDPNSFNYDPTANVNQVSITDPSNPCIPFIYGCTDSTAVNYDPLANTDNGSCIPSIYGCIDPAAHNFDPGANVSDSSCVYDAGCITGPGNPYWLNDPCYAWVIDVDEYCCTNSWDPDCQALYDYCGNVSGTLDIEDFTFNSIVVYPNPTTGNLTIRTTLDITYSLFDFTGREVLKDLNEEVIDITTLPNGVYFLSIRHHEKVFNKRIVKED
jgi:hypothetical protein